MELTPKPRRMKQNSITKLSPIYDMMDYSVSESTDKLVWVLLLGLRDDGIYWAIKLLAEEELSRVDYGFLLVCAL